MQITLDLPWVFAPGSSPEENARALRILLDGLVSLNLAFLRDHPAPSLYRSGVVYGRTTVWDTIPAVLQRGYGDCKSLTAWLVAEYRHAGHEAQPVFRIQPFSPTEQGWGNFHILVQTRRGYEDPSKRLGMGADEAVHFSR